MTDATTGPFRAVADGVRVAVRVAPRASRSRLIGIAAAGDGHTVLKIAVTAAPTDGEANQAVAVLLASALHVPRTSVTVARGATDRRKELHVAGDPLDLLARLRAWAGTGG